MKKIAAAFLMLALTSAPAFAAGDPVEGEKVFKKCATCHMVGEDAKVKTGPVLNAIFGRTAGTNEEYGKKYSKAMVEAGAGGLVWNEETMTTYLRKPKDMIKGTKMAFAGLPKDEDLANVIAYLLQFSPEYTPTN
jgi:cytochrome c2